MYSYYVKITYKLHGGGKMIFRQHVPAFNEQHARREALKLIVPPNNWLHREVDVQRSIYHIAKIAAWLIVGGGLVLAILQMVLR